MKNERKIGSVLSYLYILINSIMTFIYTPFLINYLGKSEYGIYSIAISIMSYLSMLDLGFGNAMIRYTSKYKALNNEEEEKKVNGFFLIFYVIIGIFTLIIGFLLYKYSYLIFGQKFTSSELSTMDIIILILTINIAISFPLSIFGSYVISSEKFVFQKILLIAKSIVYPIFLIVFLLNGAKSISVIVLLSLFNLLINMSNMIFALTKLKMKFNISKSCFKYFKEIINYSFFIFLAIIVDNIFNNTDQIILGAVCGTAVVAVYGVSTQIRIMNEQMSTAISGVFLPKIVFMVENKNSDKELSMLFNRISKLQMIIMFLILFGFLLFGKSFILLWSGKEYLDAYYIALIILIPAIVPLTQNICIHIIQAKNKHKFRSVIYLIISILNIFLTIPLSKLYGGIGAAIGSSIALLLGNIIIMNIYYYKRVHIDIITYWKNFAKIACVSLLYSIIFIVVLNITSIKIESWLMLIFICLIYSIGYVFIISYFIVGKSSIKKIIYNYFPNFLVKNYIILESNPDLSDNAFAIYKYMLNKEEIKNYKFIWFVNDRSTFEKNKYQNTIFVNINPHSFYEKIRKIYYNYSAKIILDCNKYVHKVHNKQLRFYLQHGISYKNVDEYASQCGKLDYFITPGKFFNDYVSIEFKIKNKQIVELGFPRNDILQSNIDVKSKLNISQKSKLVFWLPTYRSHKDVKTLGINDKVIPILNSKDQFKKLNEYLNENNIYIYIKPHPAQKIDNIENLNLSNFKIIYDKDLFNLNLNLYDFLSGTDSLITDYSSVYFDYLLTGNIIGITLDDYKDFQEKNKLICSDYSKEIGGEHIYNYNELIDYLNKVKNEDYDKEKYKVELKKYHKYNDDKSTERLYNFVVDKLK